MAWMMSGSQAKRRVLAWRGAAGVLALFAGALWAVPTPLVSPEVSIPQPAAGASGEPGPEVARPIPLAQLDGSAIEGVAERLNRVAGHADRVELPQPTQPAEPVALGAWKYLGSIIEPARRMAIVSINGKQAVIPEGREHEGMTLVRVNRDRITVDDGTRRLDIPKEARTGSSVAWVTPGTPGAGIGGNVNMMNAAGRATGMTTTGMPGQGDPAMAGFTPQEQAMMRERGIEPGQANRMRQRLQKERDLGRSRAPSNTTTSDDGRTLTTPAKPATGKDGDNTAGDSGPEAPTG